MVELTDFSVFYFQDSIAAAEASLKDKASKIVVEPARSSRRWIFLATIP